PRRRPRPTAAAGHPDAWRRSRSPSGSSPRWRATRTASGQLREGGPAGAFIRPVHPLGVTGPDPVTSGGSRGDTGRAMSEENVELGRTILSAYEGRDLGAFWRET